MALWSRAGCLALFYIVALSEMEFRVTEGFAGHMAWRGRQHDAESSREHEEIGI